jgi:hypothetical protein
MLGTSNQSVPEMAIELIMVKKNSFNEHDPWL